MALTELEREMTTALIQCQKMMRNLIPQIKWIELSIKPEDVRLTKETGELLTTLLCKSSLVAEQRERYTDPKTEPLSYLMALRGWHRVWESRATQETQSMVYIMERPHYSPIFGCWVFLCLNGHGHAVIVPVGDVIPLPHHCPTTLSNPPGSL